MVRSVVVAEGAYDAVFVIMVGGRRRGTRAAKRDSHGHLGLLPVAVLVVAAIGKVFVLAHLVGPGFTLKVLPIGVPYFQRVTLVVVAEVVVGAGIILARGVHPFQSALRVVVIGDGGICWELFFDETAQRVVAESNGVLPYRNALQNAALVVAGHGVGGEAVALSGVFAEEVLVESIEATVDTIVEHHAVATPAFEYIVEQMPLYVIIIVLVLLIEHVGRGGFGPHPFEVVGFCRSDEESVG